MAYGHRQLGELTSQLAEALDDLAIAVENYRIKECADSGAALSQEIVLAAVKKAQQASRQ